MIVYQLTNNINQKRYIGITTQLLYRRIAEHKLRAKKERGQKNKLYAAINKYGIENFKIEIIAECNSKEELEKKEIELIEKHKPEYNIAPGGSVGCFGYKWSDEQRKHMSNYRKGLLVGKKNGMYGRKGKDNPMSKPENKLKWIIAMEKRGYNMENTRRKLLGGTS